MTLEVGYKINEQMLPLGKIAAGEIATFSDFTSGSRHIIALYCLPADNGGEVYRLSGNPVEENPEVRLATAESFINGELISGIDTGGSFEMDIVTENRRAARLILRHLI